MVMKIAVLGDAQYGVPARAVWPNANIKCFNTSMDQPLNDMMHFDPGLIQFTGGSDVHPSMYGAEVDPRSQTNIRRDKIEKAIFKHFSGMPMVGICRGSQFLYAMLGGKLVQHIDKHGIMGQHPAWMVPDFMGTLANFIVKDVNRWPRKVYLAEPPFDVTSTHHQMADAENCPEKIRLTLFGEHGDITAVEGWHDTTSPTAAVQYHPEYMDEASEGFKYYCDVLRWATKKGPVDYKPRF